MPPGLGGPKAALLVCKPSGTLPDHVASREMGLDSTSLGCHGCLEIPKLPLYPQTSPKFTDKSQRAALPAGVPWETDPQRGAPPLPATASPTGGAQSIGGAQLIYCGCAPPPSTAPSPILQQFGQVRHSPGIPQGLVARLGCGRPAASNARGATWAAGRSKNRRYLMGQPPVLLTQFFLVLIKVSLPAAPMFGVASGAPERGCQEPQPRANEVLVAGK